jgi:hypothetical protein
MRLLLVTFLLLLEVIAHCQVVLTVINRSPDDIDSLILNGAKNINFGKIAAGATTSFSISISDLNVHAVPAYTLHLYCNHHSFNTEFGGIRGARKNYDTIYFFQNGVNHFDLALLRPATFTLHFYNTSPWAIDSIYSRNQAIQRITETTPRGRLISYEFSKLAQPARIFCTHTWSGI